MWQPQKALFLGLSGAHLEIYGVHHLKERKPIHSLKGLLLAESPLPVNINDAVLLFLLDRTVL